MTKPRKKYRPRPVSLDPLARIQAAPKADREAVAMRWSSALESIARCSIASRAEIEDLADCVNTLQTMAEEMGLLQADECMPVVIEASKALQQAAQRYAAHGSARVDGPGLEALRDAVQIYEQVQNTASHWAMIQARNLTELRVRQLRKNPRPDTVVLEV